MGTRAARRAIFVAGAIWSAAAVVTACSATSDERPSVVVVHGTPALRAAMRPSGTALPDGFVVPRGASLVGPVVRDPEPHDGWTAVLLLDGSPGSLAEDFAHQAAVRGWETFPGDGGDGSVCSPVGAPASSRSEVHAVRCSIEAVPLDHHGRFMVSATQGSCIAERAVCWHDVVPSIAVVTWVGSRGFPRYKVSAAWPAPYRLLPSDAKVALPRVIPLVEDGRIVVPTEAHIVVPPVCRGDQALCQVKVTLVAASDGRRALRDLVRSTLRNKGWTVDSRTRSVVSGATARTVNLNWGDTDAVTFTLLPGRLRGQEYLVLTTFDEGGYGPIDGLEDPIP